MSGKGKGPGGDLLRARSHSQPSHWPSMMMVAMSASRGAISISVGQLARSCSLVVVRVAPSLTVVRCGSLPSAILYTDLDLDLGMCIHVVSLI